jgi:hypothetical protein
MLWAAVTLRLTQIRYFLFNMIDIVSPAGLVNGAAKCLKGLDKEVNTALLLCCAACSDDRRIAPSRHSRC